MTQERINEVFDAMIDYLAMADNDRCIELLQDFGITRSEAVELRFFDFITDNLPIEY